MSIFDRYVKPAKSLVLPTAEEALPGRSATMKVPEKHAVLATAMVPPFPAHCDQIYFGLGCFWGAERCFWQLPGVYTTAVGYSAGHTPNPIYEEVCSGMTGHNEVVLVVYDSAVLPLEKLLAVFWESHNPTEGMSQGNDVGTQYRSGIYCLDETQLQLAKQSRQRYQQALTQSKRKIAEITTEVEMAGPFYYAEPYHQQYLEKNPGGYCGLGGLGIKCELE